MGLSDVNFESGSKLADIGELAFEDCLSLGFVFLYQLKLFSDPVSSIARI
jgi:hypothetical protein